MASDLVLRSFAFEDMGFTFESATSPIFEHVTFTVPTTKSVWIRSPGGRGKSTLLRILAGLVTPNEGRYLINGENTTAMSFEEFLKFRLLIGYGFDMGGLLNNRSLAENLMLPLLYHKLLPPDEAEARVNETMEMFGITEFKNQRPFAVSGSMRKLTCLLRALIHWPQVVFLDDPLTGLKEDHLNDLLHYVEESYAHRGLRQVFFTSENPALANRFQTDEILISHDWFTSRSVA